MCGRYTLSDPGDLIEELGVQTRFTFKPRYNIAPTQQAPAVRMRKDGQGREVAMLRWGLVPFWAQDLAIGSRMINARSETAAEKPSFRNALKDRRCLLLTDGFYEWKKLEAKNKQPYHIHRADRKPFVFAGLWERWSKDPEIGPVETFTILTTEPNAKIAELHDRMPVILQPEAWDFWLDPSVKDSRALSECLRPCPDDFLDFTPVSRMVNSPANDVPQCLEPVQF